MKKNKFNFIVLVTIILSLSFIANLVAKSQKKQDDKINLQFDNVYITSVEFYNKDFISFETKAGNVQMQMEANKAIFTGVENSEIELFLPVDKSYRIDLEEGYSEFNNKEVSIYEEDQIVKFEDGNLYVKSEDGEEVNINSNGIFVETDDETVEIGSKGIIVKGEEDKEITGFWGKLLGKFIGFVTKSSVSLANKNTEKIIKEIVNKEQEGDVKVFGINVGDNLSSKYQKVITKNIDNVKDKKINIENKTGFIKIYAWDKNYIDLTAEMHSGKSEKEFDKINIVIDNDKECNIKTVYNIKNSSVSVNYRLKVPRSVFINKVETTTGKINIENVKGDVIARTTNGEIELENVDGIVNLKTTNGKIECEDVKSIKKAVTSNGKIEVELAEVISDVEISTSNGKIELELNENNDVEIFANTSNGSIKTSKLDFKSMINKTNEFQGTLGEGRYKINLSTSNGRIKIKKMEE